MNRNKKMEIQLYNIYIIYKYIYIYNIYVISITFF